MYSMASLSKLDHAEAEPANGLEKGTLVEKITMAEIESFLCEIKHETRLLILDAGKCALATMRCKVRRPASRNPALLVDTDKQKCDNARGVRKRVRIKIKIEKGESKLLYGNIVKKVSC